MKPASAAQDTTARILATQEVADAFFHTRLAVSVGAAAPRPGQFVQLRPRPVDGLAPFLRMPLSVAAADPTAGVIEILYEAVGPKTRALSQLATGQELGYLGPLGNAFPSPVPGTRVILVGGGIGVPPLIYLGIQLRREALAEPTLLIGARTAGKHLPDALVGPAAAETRRATDDGTRGHAGLVTDLLAESLDQPGPPVTVYTCGPHAMMAAVAALCGEQQSACYASLEEYMACGFGVCVGCVVERRRATGVYDKYSRVCVDGPVYDATDICW